MILLQYLPLQIPLAKTEMVTVREINFGHLHLRFNFGIALVKNKPTNDFRCPLYWLNLLYLFYMNTKD